MLVFTDLISNMNEEVLQARTKVFQTKLETPLNLSVSEDKWLAVSYVYGLEQGLRDYQARSFASELTLFLTEKLYDTDVYLVYREEELDNYFYTQFKNLLQEHSPKDKKFWLAFIGSMISFYKSDDSWKFERVSKYLKFRCTEAEKEMYNNIPMKPKQTFLHLLKTFDYGLQGLEYERKGQGLDTTYSINLTPSEYYRFMQVCGDTKTDKFLNLLYFHYQDNS